MMKQSERALQIWQVLISAAHNRQTITYRQLSEIIGMGSKPVVVVPPISRVWEYCERNALPHLTYLVVGQVKGAPGADFEDIDQEREKVYNYPWFSQLPPQKSDFVKP